MIPAGPGTLFTLASDGDAKADLTVRAGLPAPRPWATVSQVHGDRVVVTDEPGDHGEADALVTHRTDMTLAVFTADCLGIVLHGPESVATVHAGWRGLDAGVVERAVDAMGEVTAAAIGPHIRSCCFEVGDDVAERFPGHLTETTWGTTSVDLAGVARSRLPVDPDDVGICTRCGNDTFSHRRDRTAKRMAAMGWRP